MKAKPDPSVKKPPLSRTPDPKPDGSNPDSGNISGTTNRSPTVEAPGLTPDAGNVPENADRSPVVPPTPSERERQRANQEAAHKAETIMTGFYPMCLAMALSSGGGAYTAHDCLVYLERQMAEYGHPDSPVCRMLIEQLAMAHHQAAQLHARAAAAAENETIKILSAAAARLHAECRRTAVVLDELLRREPVKPKLKIARTG
ncbi:hypothetical protein [Zavarzinella formosa]|uniref:hypothetical protein n=1 Tax=Zavarzinella formosa TaxID=360055 RepID=UPI0002D2E35B|nr:hypothetical protein [Zavarzinella formosa]